MTKCIKHQLYGGKKRPGTGPNALAQGIIDGLACSKFCIHTVGGVIIKSAESISKQVRNCSTPTHLLL